MVFALIIQSLAANLGVSTGKHLAELCKAEYPIAVKYCLWLLAEVAVIAADVPEGLLRTESCTNTCNTHMLLMDCRCVRPDRAYFLNHVRPINSLMKKEHVDYHINSPLTRPPFTVLAQRRIRTSVAQNFLVSCEIVAACFFGEMSYVKPPASDVLKGMFVPKLSGQGATGSTVALLGALVMPHNLFLHSALVLSRKVPRSVRGINDACRYFLIETGFALVVAFLINVAMVSVSAAVCSANNLSSSNSDTCNNLTLNNASDLLKNVLGRSSSTIYAIALLASGQSSTITGTYSGQYIMQGFLNLKMKKWKRNLLTRCIAITPSLIVSIIGGSSGAGQLIIIASFSSSTSKMGPHKNSAIIMVISWILGFGIIAINIYYLSDSFVGWLIHNSLPRVANIFVGIIVFPLMAVYIFAIIYLTFRRDAVITFTEPIKHDPTKSCNIESGLKDADGEEEAEEIPYRKDLADIPLPE
ncbi:hypothetical protein EUGRSUZ_F03813 [Eucalyptus grandis]|uniref:Uncharacterized protein n=2 Tax=Eucalyptus grandis TaxID=71139 RepID=A0ACC3KMH5_EUCGR|nr:hypothetical protein EUGRSUZ_F03813 [Eucalyptus grandis]